MTVPCVAIGGITINNCDAVIDAGADFLAVSAGVWDARVVRKRRLKHLIQKFDRN